VPTSIGSALSLADEAVEVVSVGQQSGFLVVAGGRIVLAPGDFDGGPLEVGPDLEACGPDGLVGAEGGAEVADGLLAQRLVVAVDSEGGGEQPEGSLEGAEVAGADGDDGSSRSRPVPVSWRWRRRVRVGVGCRGCGDGSGPPPCAMCHARAPLWGAR